MRGQSAFDEQIYDSLVVGNDLKRIIKLDKRPNVQGMLKKGKSIHDYQKSNMGFKTSTTVEGKPKPTNAVQQERFKASG